MEFNGEWFDNPDEIPVCGNCWDFSLCGTTRGPDDSCGNFRNEAPEDAPVIGGDFGEL